MSGLLQDGTGLGAVLRQLAALRATVAFLRSLAGAWRTAELLGSVQAAGIAAALAHVEALCAHRDYAPALRQQRVTEAAEHSRRQLEREARYARVTPGPMVLERWGHLAQIVSDAAARLEQVCDEGEREIDGLLGRRAA